MRKLACSSLAISFVSQGVYYNAKGWAKNEVRKTRNCRSHVIGFFADHCNGFQSWSIGIRKHTTTVLSHSSWIPKKKRISWLPLNELNLFLCFWPWSIYFACPSSSWQRLLVENIFQSSYAADSVSLLEHPPCYIASTHKLFSRHWFLHSLGCPRIFSDHCVSVTGTIFRGSSGVKEDKRLIHYEKGSHAPSCVNGRFCCSKTSAHGQYRS